MMNLKVAMKKAYLLFISVELFLGAYAFAAGQELNISGRKDRVLTIEARTQVLEVASECLNQVDKEFVAILEQLANPYSFKQESDPVVIEPEVSEPAPVVYDDSSVLKAIGASFANNVRGTLARGATRYLQLQGGGMLKSGTSFPATLPQVEGKTFTVTVTDINPHAYTLQMGDATLTLSIDGSSPHGSAPSNAASE
jgi:hypothetical protein